MYLVCVCVYVCVCACVYVRACALAYECRCLRACARAYVCAVVVVSTTGLSQSVRVFNKKLLLLPARLCLFSCHKLRFPVEKCYIKNVLLLIISKSRPMQVQVIMKSNRFVQKPRRWYMISMIKITG